jgi:uncharacterized protein involved in exopolysaccharide biosynthesis
MVQGWGRLRPHIPSTLLPRRVLTRGGSTRTTRLRGCGEAWSAGFGSGFPAATRSRPWHALCVFASTSVSIDPSASKPTARARVLLLLPLLHLHGAGLVLAMAAAATLGAALYVARLPITYRSTVTVLIGPGWRPGDAGQSYWSEREYLQTQAKLLTSRELATRTVQRLGLADDPSFRGRAGRGDWPLENGPLGEAASALQHMVDAKLTEGTRIIAVSLDDTSPQRAQRLLRGLLESFAEQNVAEPSNSVPDQPDLREELGQLTRRLAAARVQRERIAAKLGELRLGSVETSGNSELEFRYAAVKQRARDLRQLDTEFERFERLKEDSEHLFSLVVERSKLADGLGQAPTDEIRVLDAPMPGVRMEPSLLGPVVFGLIVGLGVGLVAAFGRLLCAAKPSGEGRVDRWRSRAPGQYRPTVGRI